MRNFINPVRLLFYTLSILVCFFVGTFMTYLIVAGQSQTLAGEGIILFYGIVSATVALLIAIYVAFYSRLADLILINKVLGLFLVIIAFFVVYRTANFETNANYFDKSPQIIKKSRKIDLVQVSLFSTTPSISQLIIEDEQIGIGFFKPNYYEYPTLYFYGNVNLEKGLTAHLPVDSLVFVKNQFSEPTTSYAPAWLFPEHIKLDYGIVYFKVIGIGFDFVKGIANK